MIFNISGSDQLREDDLLKFEQQKNDCNEKLNHQNQE